MAEVDIMNTALAAIGQEPVADLSAPSLAGSIAATKLLRSIETSRSVVLRRHGWLCALEYATLAPATIAGYVNWRYPGVFLVPGASLRVWEIEGCSFNLLLLGGWGPRWQVGSTEVSGAAQIIIRSAGCPPSLNIAYVRLADWAALDAHVCDAIAADLAARGCYSVTGDKAQADRLVKWAEQQVLLAISVEAAEEGGQPPLQISIPALIRRLSR